MFQCDGGGEFTSSAFINHLASCGIKQLISCPYTPQQNGMAERKHRHLTELSLSMMFESKVPQSFWVEAFFTANFLSNLLPHSASTSHLCPYEILNEKPPIYTSLRTFGCACYPSLRPYAQNKFDPRTLKCVFLGYNEKYKGYQCYHPPTARVYISRHVLFDETDFPFGAEYNHLHYAKTELLSAWQSCFQQSPSLTNNSTPATTESPLLQPPSASVTTSDERQNSAPSQDTVSHPPTLSSVSNSSPATVSTTATENRSPGCTTGIEPASIGNSYDSQPARTDDTVASPETSSTDINSSNSTFADSLFSDEDFPPLSASIPEPIQNDHSMVTRGKTGIVKPNPKYALLTTSKIPAEPKFIASALKHDG